MDMDPQDKADLIHTAMILTFLAIMIIGLAYACS